MQLKKLFAGVVVSATTLAFAGMANGQAWEGDVSSDWYDGDNWDGDSAPSGASAVVTIGTPDTHHPVLNLNGGNVTIGSLTIQGGGFLTVSNSGTVGEKLLITNSGTPDGDVTVATQGQIVLSAKALVEVEGPMDIQAGTTNSGGQVRVEDDTAELEVDGVVTIGFHATNPGQLRIGELPGTLDVGGTVTLTGAVTHLIDGFVELRNEDSVLLVSDSMTFSYDTTPGFVTGESNSAEIRIANGEKLTNSVIIAGGLLVLPDSGSATLVNQRVDSNGTGLGDALSGIIRATDNLKIEFHASLVIEDEAFMGMYRPEWGADGSTSELRFNQDAGDCGDVPLVGDFIFTNGGELFLNSVNIQTSGTYDGPASPDGTGCILSQCLDIFGSCV